MRRSIMDGRNQPDIAQLEQATAKLDGNVMQDVQQMVDACSGKSDSELLQELKTSKSRGMISSADLNSVAGKLAPMLNAEQQQRLHGILRQLND